MIFKDTICSTRVAKQNALHVSLHVIHALVFYRRSALRVGAAAMPLTFEDAVTRLRTTKLEPNDEQKLAIYSWSRRAAGRPSAAVS